MYCDDPGTTFLGPPELGGRSTHPKPSGWVPISLPCFSPDSQGTILGEALLALGPAAGHLNKVWGPMQF